LPNSYKKEFLKNKLDEELIMSFKNEEGKILNKLFFSDMKIINIFIDGIYRINFRENIVVDIF